MFPLATSSPMGCGSHGRVRCGRRSCNDCERVRCDRAQSRLVETLEDELILGEGPRLEFVTLTLPGRGSAVRHGGLRHQLDYLRARWPVLWRRCQAAGMGAAALALEVTWNKEGKWWNGHLHLLVAWDTVPWRKERWSYEAERAGFGSRVDAKATSFDSWMDGASYLAKPASYQAKPTGVMPGSPKARHYDIAMKGRRRWSFVGRWYGSALDPDHENLSSPGRQHHVYPMTQPDGTRSTETPIPLPWSPERAHEWDLQFSRRSESAEEAIAERKWLERFNAVANIMWEGPIGHIEERTWQERVAKASSRSRRSERASGRPPPPPRPPLSGLDTSIST